MKKKKKFINKKEATTYRLIPGYVDDEEAPTKVHESQEEVDFHFLNIPWKSVRE